MKPLASTIRGQADPFAPTHWSVVLAAAGTGASPGMAEAALAELCRAYWAPLYTFVRRRGYAAPDAQDLTQGFFAHLLEHRIYAALEPGKGKFRAFLLAAIKNYLANAHDREQAQKRGGGSVHLPLLEEQAAEAESFYQSQACAGDPGAGADRHFAWSWAQAVVYAAMERVSRSYDADGKEAIFLALRPFIAGDADSLPAQRQVAATLGLPAPTVRSHVNRLRLRYREALQVEVRRTVDTESDVREELGELLRVLNAGPPDGEH